MWPEEWPDDPAADGDEGVELLHAATVRASATMLTLAANARLAKVGRIVNLSCEGMGDLASVIRRCDRVALPRVRV